MNPARLDANENPWGPSPSVAQALSSVTTGRYPEDTALETALAAQLGVEADRIVVGNGSTELIGLLILALCGPSQAIATCAGSFIAYRQLALAADRRLQLAPAHVDGGTDLDALAAVIDHDTALVFIANPDNPSGTLCTSAQLDRFFASLPSPGPLVVLDEAYREYVRTPDYPATSRFLHAPRTALLRTFSKAHGLAGVRCGYLVAAPDVSRRVRSVGGPFRVGQLTRAAALASLADAAHVHRVVDRTLAERERLRSALLARGFAVEPSHTSFLMVHLRMPAARVADHLATRGVRVCPLDAYGWTDAIRLTIGRPSENDRALAALDTLLRDR